LAKVPTPGGPAVVAPMLRYVWVTMFGIGEVWRINVAD
jgi:hypothetical protein